jgi:hypothetical protein
VPACGWEEAWRTEKQTRHPPQPTKPSRSSRSTTARANRSGKDFLIRIFDGFQNQLFDNFKPAPSTVFSLPFRDNLQDNCIVVASGKNYVDAGFSPVELSPKAVAIVDLMLLDDEADFKFQTSATLKITRQLFPRAGDDSKLCSVVA